MPFICSSLSQCEPMGRPVNKNRKSGEQNRANTKLQFKVLLIVCCLFFLSLVEPTKRNRKVIRAPSFPFILFSSPLSTLEVSEMIDCWQRHRRTAVSFNSLFSGNQITTIIVAQWAILVEMRQKSLETIYFRMNPHVELSCLWARELNAFLEMK